MLLVAAAAAVAFRWLDVGHGDFDLRVYRGAIRSWAHGGSLYGFGLGRRRLGFTYPPFAALCLFPLVSLPLGAAIVLNQLAILAELVLAIRLVVARLPVVRAPGLGLVTALVAPVALVLQPVRDTLSFGQVDLALGLLVLGDLVLLERTSRWRGVLLGLATAVKLTPGLFVVLALVAGERRMARNAVLAFAGATAGAAVIAPSTSWTFWTSALYDSSRVGSYDSASNQSLAGLLARLANGSHPPLVWLPLAVALAAVALIAARRLHLSGRTLEAFTLVGLAANLVSPISWVHHLFWVLPALLLLAERAARTRSVPWALAVAGTVAVFLSGLPDRARALGGHHLDGWTTVVGENLYAVVLLGLVATFVALAYPDPRRRLVVPASRVGAQA